MIGEEVGKYFSSTQKELLNIKRNLHHLHTTNKIGEDQNLNHIYGNIQNNVAKINHDIETKLEDLFYKMMNNHNSTVQDVPLHPDEADPLPGIESQTTPQKAAFFLNRNNSEQIFKKKPLLPPSLRQMGHEFSTGKGKLLPTFDAEARQNDPRSKPFGKQFYHAKYISQKNLEKSTSERLLQENAREVNRKEASAKNRRLLDEVNGNQREGLFEMLNKGRISKDTDLTTALLGQGLASIAVMKPMKFSDAREKVAKRVVNSGSLGSDLQNFKLEQPEKLLPQIGSAGARAAAQSQAQQQQQQLFQQQLLKKKVNENTLAATAKAVSELKLNAADPKSYPEVLDQYSLHHFMIRKGRVLEETPEFSSYKRTFYRDWQQIQSILKSLEKIMKDYAINLATIDGKALAALANRRGVPEIADLINCCVDKDDILKVIRVPRLMFKGENGKALAVTKIASAWRGFKCLREYRRLQIMIEKVKLIQKWMRLCLERKRAKTAIRDKARDDIDYVVSLREKLIQDWPVRSLQRTLQIHINCFAHDELKRLSMEKVSQRQNMQITRIFALKDPLVEVVYVSPYELSTEIVNYYYKILELGEVADFKSRLHFVSPEMASTFPSHFSLSQLLLYSPKAIKRIRSLSKGKFAYIVPGYPSNEDIKLARCLDVALLSGDTQQALICSSKSGAKRIFTQCEVPTAPAAYEIYEEKEFINTLAILILNNIRIDTWVFKIDDETCSRGIAYFDVDSIPFLKSLRKNTGGQFEIDSNLLSKLQSILAEKLPSKTKLAIPSLYLHGYREYMHLFVTKGGIIEASPTCQSSQISSPSIFFLINPVGDIKVIGSYDRITGSPYRVIGCSGPQQSLPNMNLQMMSETIGGALFARGVFGYVTVDLISFPDPSNNDAHPLFWAVGLDCYLNNSSAACFYFNFLVKGHADPINGECILEPSNEPIVPRRASEQYNHFADRVTGGSNNVTAAGGNHHGNTSSTSSLPYLQQQQFSHSGSVLPNFINETRSFVYFPYIQHQGLEQLQYKSFFHLCRVDSVSFDLEKRIGSTFVLLDSLQSSLVGVMTVAENQLLGLKYLSDTLKFLQKHLGTSNDKFNGGGAGSDMRTDKIYFSDLVSRLKLILRKYDRILNYVPPHLVSKNRKGSSYI